MEDNKFTLEKRIQNIERFIFSLILFLIFIYELIEPNQYILSLGYASFFTLFIVTTISYIYVVIYFGSICALIVSDASEFLKNFIKRYKDPLKVTFLIIAGIIGLLVMYALEVELKGIISGSISGIITFILINNYNKLKKWMGKN